MMSLKGQKLDEVFGLAASETAVCDGPAVDHNPEGPPAGEFLMMKVRWALGQFATCDSSRRLACLRRLPTQQISARRRILEVVRLAFDNLLNFKPG